MDAWHSRGYLPHFEAGDRPQFVTFRLADSLPQHVMRELVVDASAATAGAATARLSRELDRHLDAGHGDRLLAEPRLAGIVEQALLREDGRCYRLHGWVVMPNHVHVLLTPVPPATLAAVVRTWEGTTAHAINAALGRSGGVWYREYFDRYMRDHDHLLKTLSYIHQNPVRAGLCVAAEDWPFTSARGSLADLA